MNLEFFMLEMVVKKTVLKTQSRIKENKRLGEWVFVWCPIAVKMKLQ